MKSSEYVFYSVFVEEEKSNRYLCYTRGEFIVVRDGIMNCERLFGLIPYEQILNSVDLLEAVLKRTVVIVREDPAVDVYKGYFVEKNTKLCLQEIVGSFVYILKAEGDEVKMNEKVAYVITGKMEVRNVFSRCEGAVLFVVDMVWESPRKVVLVVVPGELREVAVRKSP
ncbi:MAG: DUF2118 domain-containing protein [Desulfurococcaceae archaeon]